MLKVVRIDVATHEVTASEFDPNTVLGGRGLIGKVLLEEVDAKCDPLGKDNKLIFTTSVFAGYRFPTGNRLSAGAKSPLTGTIKESNAGGTFATYLAKHGIKMLIVENIPNDNSWHTIRIDKKGNVFLETAEELRLKGTYESVKSLHEKYGKKASVAVIGPGGERLSTAASIQVTDFNGGHPSRALGRGGLGAVMGSKGIKAIVLEEPEANNLPAYDDQKVKEITKEFTKMALASEGSKFLKQYGTTGTLSMTTKMNALPVDNFSGRMMTEEEQAQFNMETYADRINSYGGKQGISCQAGCPIQCSNVYNNEVGEMITSGLEYETIAMAGPNCSIFNWDFVAEFDRICDDYGVDTIDVADALGVAMDAGFIPFGDIDAAYGLLAEMREGTEFGLVLANGTQATGEYLNHDRIPTCKGQAFPAYDPRAIKGTGVTYATFPQGADHTGGMTTRVPGVDPYGSENQTSASKGMQYAFALVDNYCCLMGAGMILAPESMPKLVELYHAIYGITVSPEQLGSMGVKSITMEREFNTLAGFTPKDDVMPKFMREESLAIKPSKFDVDQDEIERMYVEA